MDQSHLERVAQRITAAVARDASGPHGSELADQPGEREENEVEQPRPRRLRGTLSFGDVEQLLPVELRIDVRPAAADQAVEFVDVARVFRRDANGASAREIAYSNTNARSTSRSIAGWSLGISGLMCMPKRIEHRRARALGARLVQPPWSASSGWSRVISIAGVFELEARAADLAGGVVHRRRKIERRRGRRRLKPP